MNSRGRVRAAIHHKVPDRLPCNEDFWEDTLSLWRQQGLPANVDPADYFDFDLCGMAIDGSMRFEQKVLRREGDYLVYTDRAGYTVRRLEGKGATMQFSDHKTVDKAAWERHKTRLTLSVDPAAPARIDSASYFRHLDPYPTWAEAVEKYKHIYAANRYMLFNCYGPWEATWRHRGYEDLLMDVATDPDWVKEMADTHQDLVIAILQHCLDLGMKPDGYFAVDDISYNKGMLISPDSWRYAFKPAVARLGGFLAAHDIDFWMHSCGNCGAVIDDLIECGLKVLNPLQASAGFHVVKLRERYGKRLAFYGNIDVNKLAGPKGELEQEIKAKAAIARAGGYIFHSDHSVPPQVSFERYQWALATARECAAPIGR